MEMTSLGRKPFCAPLHAGDMLTIEEPDSGHQIIFEVSKRIGPNQSQFFATISLPPGYRVAAVDYADRGPVPEPPRTRPAHDPRHATAARRMAVKMMHADRHTPTAVREMCRRAIGVVDELRALREGEGRVAVGDGDGELSGRGA
jgi:hypothetical protein